MSAGQQNTSHSNQDQRAGSEPPADLGTLKEDVGQVAEAAVERGRQFVQSAQAQAAGYVEQRKNDLAQSVADLADALRDASKPFDDRPNIKVFIDNAVGGLDQLADTVRSRSMAEIYGDIEDILRRRPAAVAATTLAAGFLISRFIKASADNLRAADAGRRFSGQRSAGSSSSSGHPVTVRL